MIGLIGAMSLEMEELLKKMTHTESVSMGTMRFTTGMLFNKRVVVSVCGVGKVNAAICACEMIHLFHPDAIINLGVAGAIASSLNIGDIVIADACVQHDMDTTAVGDPLGWISGIDLVKIESDKVLCDKLVQAAQASKMNVHVGIVATGDQFICTTAQKEHIQSNFNAIACEMEGAAIAHACIMYGVPACIIRSISDKADGSAEMDYPMFVKLAAAQSSKLIETFLANVS